MVQQLAIAIVLVAGPVVSADDWPHWRGPTRDGHTKESSGWTGGAWPGKEPLWKAGAGEGCTSPIIVKGRLYTLGWFKDKDYVLCMDAATGKRLWTQEYKAPRYGRHHLGDEDAYCGPTATPEFDVDTGFLYTLGADGELACWDTTDEGKRVWGFNLYDKFGAPRRPEVGRVGTRRDYGYITAPLVHRNWLVVAVGSSEGHLMAFDKRTGERRWVSKCKEPAGHCGGLAPITVGGIPCVASLTLRKLVVIRLDVANMGETAAEYDWITDFGNNVATPAVHRNFVLITSKYNRAAMCKLEISIEGAKKVWEAPYSSGACTPVILNGHIYWTSERMRCLDFETGKQKWEGGDWGSPGSCIATADGKLIAWGHNGRLALVEPGDKYKELARDVRVFQAASWPHVAIADGRLYCKDRNGNIKCFAVK